MSLQGNKAWAPADADADNSALPHAVAGRSSRPLLYLTIDSAEQLPAAEAVIAALYAVPDAHDSLQQHQHVCALLIAD
jgi:hypothetical protein